MLLAPEARTKRHPEYSAAKSGDDELVELTHQSIENLRSVVDAGRIPPPLEDSPKCPSCSLVGVCLPDETNLLRLTSENVRPLSVRHTRALPVYIQTQHGKVAKKGERLAITKGDDEAVYARLAETSQLVVMGNVYVTTPTLHELMRRNIPVTWQSYGGWFLGHTVGSGHANVELRTAQYKGSFEDQVCLKLARGWVQAKIRNSRTLLRRNWRRDDDLSPVLTDLKRLADQAGRTREMNSLLGIEGAAAARYFQHFTGMLKQSGDTDLFQMNNRNRRPPTDPVNALLSFGYAMLTRTDGGGALRHGIRPLSRVLSPASVRTPRAGLGHDGAVPSADRGICSGHRDQQRGGSSHRLCAQGNGHQSIRRGP